VLLKSSPAKRADKVILAHKASVLNRIRLQAHAPPFL
jgi:hypothetical protein